nr:MAG TPA: hypothetical protein [Caudoviricetes sp.]
MYQKRAGLPRALSPYSTQPDVVGCYGRRI